MDQPLILVIDDSQTIRKLVECHLSQAGYRVAMAADAEHGLELARTLQPQLILLDHQLPGTTGDEVCRKLLDDEATARIPVVISSAMRNRAYAQYTEFPNVVDQIPKPFTPELLKSGVANALQTGAMVVQAQRTGCAMPEAVGEVHDALLEGKTGVVPAAGAPRFPEQSSADRPADRGSRQGPGAVRPGRRPGPGGVLADDRPGPPRGLAPGRARRPRSAPGADTRGAAGCVDGRADQAAGAKPVRSQAAPGPAPVPGGIPDVPGHDRRAGQVRIRTSDRPAADVPGISPAMLRPGPGHRRIAILRSGPRSRRMGKAGLRPSVAPGRESRSCRPDQRGDQDPYIARRRPQPGRGGPAVRARTRRGRGHRAGPGAGRPGRAPGPDQLGFHPRRGRRPGDRPASSATRSAPKRAFSD